MLVEMPHKNLNQHFSLNVTFFVTEEVIYKF